MLFQNRSIGGKAGAFSRKVGSTHAEKPIGNKRFKSILRQNVGFFDNMGAGEITTRITADMNTIQDGISEKVALVITITLASLLAETF